MKYIVITSICLFVSFLLACSHQKKMTYEFPAAMSATTQAGFTVICNKGKVLYDINCAHCHNMKVKGKNVIPDFTEEQLHAYELRVLNPQHENAMADTKVNAEELGNICFFLTYKKKTNMPFKSTTHVDKADDHSHQ